MLGMPAICQRLQQLGVAVRAAAVLRRAGTLTTDTARQLIAAAEHLHIVLPPVTEVVGIDEPRRQRGQRHPPLIDLSLTVVPVFERDRIDSCVGAELVQVRVGPAERDLEHLVQLVEGDRVGHVDHPLHPRHHRTHRDSQPSGPHRDPSGPGAAQHFLYLRPEPHQHASLRPGGQAITRDRSRPRSAAYQARNCAASS